MNYELHRSDGGIPSVPVEVREDRNQVSQLISQYAVSFLWFIPQMAG